MGIIRLDSYKINKLYEQYYRFTNLHKSTNLHIGKHSNDFHKQYTAAYIKLLSENINKEQIK